MIRKRFEKLKENKNLFHLDVFLICNLNMVKINLIHILCIVILQSEHNYQCENCKNHKNIWNFEVKLNISILSMNTNDQMNE